jgi:CRP-like cAMP-binding protein
VLGGLALFAVGAREASAVGGERSEVLLLRREDFLRLAEDSPRTACRVAMALSADLAAALRNALDEWPNPSVDPIRPGE